jgi:hypothetical protein
MTIVFFRRFVLSDDGYWLMNIASGCNKLTEHN